MPVQGEKGQNIYRGLGLTLPEKATDSLKPNKQLHQYYFYKVGGATEARSAAQSYRFQ